MLNKIGESLVELLDTVALNLVKEDFQKAINTKSAEPIQSIDIAKFNNAKEINNAKSKKTNSY